MTEPAVATIERQQEGMEAEDRLRFFSAVLEQSPVSIVITDLQGTITFVNRKACEISGYTFEELKGANPRLLKSGETSVEEYKHLWRTIQTGEWHGVFHNKRKNGELFWESATISAIRDARGVPTHYLAIMEDISEQKAMEARLQASEERFRIAAHHASDLIWELNLETGAIDVHGPVEQLIGISNEQIAGRFENWIRSIHPDDLTTFLATVLDMVRPPTQRRSAKPCEYRRLLPDGSIRYWADRGTRMMDASGRAYKWIGVSTDVTERKNAADALAKSEQLHRTIVETSAQGIWIADANSVFTFSNRQFLAMLDMTSGELLGRTTAQLTPEEDHEELGRVRQALRQGQKVSGQFRMKRKDGSQMWMSIAASPFFGTDGQYEGALGMATDVTEQKAAQEALQTSEERFRVAAQCTNDLIYEWDLVSGMAEVFSSLGTLAASGGGAYVHDDFYRMIHPDDREAVQRAISRHLETGERFQQEYRVVMPDGATQYWLDQGKALRGAGGTPYKWIGACTDITDRKLAEKALADSEERFRLITETIREVFWLTDADLNKTIYVSPAYERVWGHSRESLYEHPRSFLEAVHPQDMADVRERNLSGRSRGEPFDQEYRIVAPDGSVKWIWDRAFPVRRPDGSVCQFVGVAMDISERKHLERQLAQAQKLESIGQLAAGIAHEINTPIQYIGDNAKFLEDAFQDMIGVLNAKSSRERVDLEYLAEEVPKSIAQLLDGVERVARIVRAMKDFSHPGQVEKTLSNLNSAIEGTIVVSRNEWKYVAELTTGLDPNLPLVPCIVSEFNQALLNLIVNAAHAIADVHRETGRLGEIHISTRTAGDSVEVQVRDTGTGIPEAVRSKIFDPFFTTKPVGKGTGQGLSIAHAVVVQKHGGTLTYETEVGRGTTFFIRLPLGGNA